MRHAPRTLLFLGLILLTVWVWRQALAPSPYLTVTFLDVGQGDSIVIQTPGGHTLVIDTGRRTPDDDMGRRVVLPFLRAQGVHHLSALLLTHPDDDHIGGAVTLLERLSVGRLLLSPLPSNTPNYLETLDAARRNRVPVTTLARGQTLDFRDGVVADVLHPAVSGPPPSEHPDNNASLVLRLRYEKVSILLTGDAEREAEEEMVRSKREMASGLLKLGHHGSLTSSTERFLDAVRPQAAIVSAGRNNSFGHPHPDVLARLAARQIHVFRTDKHGTITVTSDGRTLRVTTTLRE
jgi:competence protein ComEC